MWHTTLNNCRKNWIDSFEDGRTVVAIAESLDLPRSIEPEMAAFVGFDVDCIEARFSAFHQNANDANRARLRKLFSAR